MEVAKLAGIPDEVTNAAALDLAKNLNAERAKTSATETTKAQLIVSEPSDYQRLKTLEDKLNQLKIEELSPLQALIKLNELKGLLN